MVKRGSIRLSRILTSAVFFVNVIFNIGTSASGQIKWKLVTNPVIFGENASIRCTIVEEKKPGHMAWKKCSGGHSTCATVGFNEISLNDTKYKVVMKSYNTSMMTYELTIKQFGAMDVNYKYRCESGFQYGLGEVSLNEVVAFPKDHQIEKTFDMKDNNLTALIRIPHVYPRPICSAIFKKRNITNMMNTTYIHQDVLYVAVCEVFYETYECKGDLSIFCKVGMLNIPVVHSFDECVEISPADQPVNSIKPVLIISSIAVFGVLFAICVVYIRCKRRPSRNRQTASKHELEPL